MVSVIITILGRQPALGLAELERVFGGKSVKPASGESATVDIDNIDIQRFGGILKAGVIIDKISGNDWQHVSNQIVKYFTSELKTFDGKVTLGISAYNLPLNPREVQKVGIAIKQILKRDGVSLRLIPNTGAALTTATSHHNKLGLSPNKIELLIVKSRSGQIYVAKSLGAQNITAYAKRDQARPMRDAFVGMLPPKLAQIMINLAVGQNGDKGITVLDPFCGTGVILQEAALMGYSVYGTDLSEKMIRYSRDNLNWLADSHHVQPDWYLRADDAMTAKWRQPINAVVCESYLGQPFSAPPSATKLDEVVNNCNHIISEFLRNLSSQIQPGIPVCIAVPAWRDKNGNFTHLPIIQTIARLGYRSHEFINVSQNEMLYYREDQVVARELLVIVKQ